MNYREDINIISNDINHNNCTIKTNINSSIIQNNISNDNNIIITTLNNLNNTLTNKSNKNSFQTLKENSNKLTTVNLDNIINTNTFNDISINSNNINHDDFTYKTNTNSSNKHINIVNDNSTFTISTNNSNNKLTSKSKKKFNQNLLENSNKISLTIVDDKINNNSSNVTSINLNNTNHNDFIYKTDTNSCNNHIDISNGNKIINTSSNKSNNKTTIKSNKKSYQNISENSDKISPTFLDNRINNNPSNEISINSNNTHHKDFIYKTNTNSFKNHSSISDDNNTTIITINNCNSTSTNKSNKKSYQNLVENSDKISITISDNIMNNNSFNDISIISSNTNHNVSTYITNTNPPSNHTNISNDNITITTSTTNSKSTNKLNMKSFQNLILDSDKKLICSLDKVRNFKHTIEKNMNSKNINNEGSTVNFDSNSIDNSNFNINITHHMNSNNIASNNFNVNSTKDQHLSLTKNISTNELTFNSNTNQSYISSYNNKNIISSNTSYIKSVTFSIINPTNNIEMTNFNNKIINKSTITTNMESLINSNSILNNTSTISSLNKSVDNHNIDLNITYNKIKSSIININNKSSNELINNTSNIPLNCISDNLILDSNLSLNSTCNINTINLRNSFSTTIYRKPTYSGLITKWKSFVPHSYKISTISSMIYRAIKICSTYELLHEEFEFIEFICQLNGYPINFIRSQIRKTFNRYWDKINGTVTNKSKKEKINDIDNTLNKRHIFVDIPFVGKSTSIFKKEIIKIAKNIDPKINIQPIERPPTTIAQNFPIKDQVPKLLKSKVVYKINCLDCESTYIGKTIRHVSKRLHEHGAKFNVTNETNSNSTITTDTYINLRRSERNKNKIVNYFPKLPNIETIVEHNNILPHSSVKQHEINNNHKMDWINFDIVARDNKNYQLLIKESILINNLKPSLNRTTTSAPLIIYPEGLKTHKPKVKIKSTGVSLPMDVV